MDILIRWNALSRVRHNISNESVFYLGENRGESWLNLCKCFIRISKQRHSADLLYCLLMNYDGLEMWYRRAQKLVSNVTFVPQWSIALCFSLSHDIFFAGTRKNSNGPIIACVQRNMYNNLKHVNFTEDCLLLNIWIPFPQKKNLSVMVRKDAHRTTFKRRFLAQHCYTINR